MARKIKGQDPEQELKGDNKGHGNGGWYPDTRKGREGKFRVITCLLDMGN